MTLTFDNDAGVFEETELISCFSGLVSSRLFEATIAPMDIVFKSFVVSETIGGVEAASFPAIIVDIDEVEDVCS